jgi:CBS domain-containing protein
LILKLWHLEYQALKGSSREMCKIGQYMRHLKKKTYDKEDLTFGIMYTSMTSNTSPEGREEAAMHVGDMLRRKSPRVVTVRMNETIGIAAKLMRANNVGAVVVQDVVHSEGNTTVGIFTDRDVVRAITSRGAAAVNMKVSQFISVPRLVSCSSKDTLESVHDIMDQHHVRHLPVIDDHNFIGVIGMQDITSALDCIAASTAQAA